MIKTFGRTLCVMIGLLVANAAHADPLIFYYDQASWLAAAAGLQIGTYSSGSTRTDFFVTENYLTHTIVKVSTITTVTPNGGFSSISTPLPLGFSFPNSCTPIPAGCFGTALQEITISFDSPILGFEADAAIEAIGGIHPIFLNGQN